MVLRNPCTWLAARSFHEDDTESDRLLKSVTIPAATTCAVILSATLLLTGDWRMDAFTVGCLLYVLTASPVIARAICTQKLSLRAVVVCISFGLLTIFMLDWSAAAVPGSVRVWPLSVLVMDLLLVIGAPGWVVEACTLCTVMWVLIMSTENAFRLGLYDIDGWTEPPGDVLRDRVGCANPPCSVGALSGFNAAATGIVAVVLDFSVTRGFSSGMRQRQEEMRMSVSVAQQVASHLALFDLDSARSTLDCARDSFPEEFKGPLTRLLNNLASYRPYLPQSCLPSYSDDVDDRDSTGESLGRVVRASEHRSSASALEMSPEVPTLAPLSSVDRPGGYDGYNDPLAFSVQSKVSAQRSESGSDLGSRTASFPPVQTPAKGRRGHVGSVLGREAATKRVTFVMTNRTGFTAAAALVEADEMARWFTCDIAFFACQVNLQRGIVDVVNGDHRSASFGAARPCVSHRLSAVRVADAICLADQEFSNAQRGASARLGGLATTAAVSTGKGACGDFGSATLQRFMVVGKVQSALYLLDRLVARWRLRVLVDNIVQSDASTAFECRAVRTVSNPAFPTGETALWEVVRPLRTDRHASQGEWMYGLESMETTKWEALNVATDLWTRGSADNALLALERALESGEEDLSPDVRKSLILLRSKILRKVDPVVTVTDIGVSDDHLRGSCLELVPGSLSS
eukprot:TRINITY_DN6969_c0_g1_i1.p1 TRINITY_DN6969_c0_g1~~TRINITY_DN6969_c0_g1_i1.p1  ORF type:complete len:687 (+),score=139.75 TRINITY_DN6969_c0_g1_i1:148-2208(+)